MPETAAAHPVLAQLLALIEQEATNPGPIVKALESYLLGLVIPAAGPVVPAADMATVKACCAKHCK